MLQNTFRLQHSRALRLIVKPLAQEWPTEHKELQHDHTNNITNDIGPQHRTPTSIPKTPTSPRPKQPQTHKAKQNTHTSIFLSSSSSSQQKTKTKQSHIRSHTHPPLQRAILIRQDDQKLLLHCRSSSQARSSGSCHFSCCLVDV